ncbi:MAG: hypothetical protein CL570_04710 [Alphaproteobacteria bacterium]|nr:hypothetical protein [Alphaproteobacteria bacterium]HCQ71594.1 hypothetical protein [Rhodospirillaceae bacterium]|tara:strand:- start:11616 stop:13151 length:1536 start_codon:yes stop_codon:yes gene_type:complete
MPNKHDATKLLHAVLEHVSDGIITADKAGKIYYYSASSEKIFGYERSQVRDLNLKALLPDFATMVDFSVAEYLVKALHQDGRNSDVAVSVSEVPSAEGDILNCYIIRDVTYRKVAEQRLIQAQKMEAIGVITSTVAHNFNNLLGVVSGSLRLLKRGLPANVAENENVNLHLDTIESAVHRGASQISRLMMFARPQTTAPQEGALTNIEISEFVDQIKDLIVLSVRDTVRVAFDLQAKLPAVRLDVGQFESALLNMAVNASDAMPYGGHLHISTQSVTLDRNYKFLSPEVVEGEYVCVTVSDTGEGMSEDVQEHLFEPFYTTKPAGAGTGLGMSVVYGCVNQIGGYIHVYSEIGNGTTFKIYLPACPQDIKVNYADQKQESIQCDDSGKTVLIIDDQYLMRDMASQSFSRLGFKVLTASTAHEALSAVNDQNGAIDLLFVDMFIEEGVDSFDLVDHILTQVRPECQVLYTSGYDEQQLAQSYDVREKNFISKPFSNKRLIEALKAFWPEMPF